jgi:hypothetical protein
MCTILAHFVLSGSLICLATNAARCLDLNKVGGESKFSPPSLFKSGQNGPKITCTTEVFFFKKYGFSNLQCLQNSLRVNLSQISLFIPSCLRR